MTASAGGFRILVTDPVISRFADVMKEHAGDHEWMFAMDWSADRVLQTMPSVDVVVSSIMSPDMAKAGERLKLVHATGAGFDKLPLADLAEGVVVANTYHHGRSIAEHVIMVTLMLSRRALQVDAEMRAGTWRNIVNDPDVPFHTELSGRAMGLIGFGSIGQEVARLATALGMSVRAVRQNPQGAVPSDLDLAWVGSVDQLHELMAASDVVVVTVPLNEHTRSLVDARALGAMKSSAYLVNVARGPVVNEDALYRALVDGVIAGAALDVWWGNPADPKDPAPATRPFMDLPNVVVTPHHSGNSLATFQQRAADIGANIARLASGEPLVNLVHPQPGQR